MTRSYQAFDEARDASFSAGVKEMGLSLFTHIDVKRVYLLFEQGNLITRCPPGIRWSSYMRFTVATGSSNDGSMQNTTLRVVGAEYGIVFQHHRV